tara:strand:+ start:919 stop:1212 length:294 start_codon:yes stop_codon:yes gene_type:complete
MTIKLTRDFNNQATPTQYGYDATRFIVDIPDSNTWGNVLNMIAKFKQAHGDVGFIASELENEDQCKNQHEDPVFVNAIYIDQNLADRFENEFNLEFN